MNLYDLLSTLVRIGWAARLNTRRVGADLGCQKTNENNRHFSRVSLAHFFVVCLAHPFWPMNKSPHTFRSSVGTDRYPPSKLNYSADFRPEHRAEQHQNVSKSSILMKNILILKNFHEIQGYYGPDRAQTELESVAFSI